MITPNKTSLFSMNTVYNDMNNDIRRDANQNNKFGGRREIIWNLIFMIPVVFTSMIHDSYKNFLPDSWFTKTFDDLFIKWISQRLLCLVLHSFFFWSVQTSVFIQNYIDFSTTVSLYHHSFCPDMAFCYWTLSTSVIGETSGLSVPNAQII